MTLINDYSIGDDVVLVKYVILYFDLVSMGKIHICLV